MDAINGTTVAVFTDRGIINKDLIFPEDTYLLVAWTVMWGVAHHSFKPFMKSIAAQYAKESPSSVASTVPPRYNLRRRRHKTPETASTAMASKMSGKNAVKFATSAWKFTNYTIMTIIGAYVLYNEPWIFSPKDYFQGWPETHNMS
ncbi:hypothetical protein HDU67_009491, partial [Dinochytrium kinnereticum]